MKSVLLVTTALIATTIVTVSARAETAQVGASAAVAGGSGTGSFTTNPGVPGRNPHGRVDISGNGSFEQRNFSSTNARYIDESIERESPVARENSAFAVKLAGTVRVDAQWVNQDSEQQGMRPDFSLFDNRRDFSLLGVATSSNGLTYGFEIDVGIHRGQIYVMSDYGRVSMGDTFSAAEALDVGGRSVMVGYGHYAAGGSKNVNTGTMSGSGVVSYRGQGGTIRYTSPNVSGVTVSVSYTEESDTDMVDGSGTATSEDILSFAAQYTTFYGNWQAVYYGGYEHSNAAGMTTGATGRIDQDQHLFSTGAKVSGMGAAFGVGYGHAEVDLPGAMDNDKTWIDGGVAYGAGPWSVSAGASFLWDEEGEIGGIDVDGEATAISGSFNYVLAPGIAIAGGVTHHIIDNATFVNTDGTRSIGDNDATTWTLSTVVNF